MTNRSGEVKVLCRGGLNEEHGPRELARDETKGPGRWESCEKEEGELISGKEIYRGRVRRSVIWKIEYTSLFLLLKNRKHTKFVHVTNL